MNTEQNGNNISPKSASSFPFQRAVPRDANGRDDKREAELKRGDKKKRENTRLAHLTVTGKKLVRNLQL